MKIRYLTGPAAGEVRHVENSIGRDAIDSGRAEAVFDRTPTQVFEWKDGKPTPIVKPTFSVGIISGPTGRKFLALSCEILHRKDYFSGDPDTITDKDFGRPVSSIPPDVLADYAKKWNANPELRDAYASYSGIPGIRGAVSNSTIREFADTKDGNKRIAAAQGQLPNEVNGNS